MLSGSCKPYKAFSCCGLTDHMFTHRSIHACMILGNHNAFQHMNMGSWSLARQGHKEWPYTQDTLPTEATAILKRLGSTTPPYLRLQHSTAQHSTAQHSTAQHSTVVPADRYLEATKDRILSIRALMGPASECHSALDSSTLPKASNSTNRPAHVHAQLRQCPCCCTKQAAVHHVPNCSRRVPNCGKTC